MQVAASFYLDESVCDVAYTRGNHLVNARYNS
jgi:hypothetical protein